MNWKNFKNWLDKNIVENEELTVKVKLKKQNNYGELSTITLTNFCDSLEATLDNNTSYHLFPEFAGDKEFRGIFNYQNCFFGKKTNQENTSEIDFVLLEKLFNEWKSTQINNNNRNINNTTMNTRNILLIGRTGSGKSTLANVLMGEDRFKESAKSVSSTKHVEEGVFEVDLDKEGNEKIRYRVIDTIGIGDTEMKPQGVLMRLAEMADWVKEEGLNQILFVTRSRFTKEEIEAYDLLSSIIFDKEFEDKEACDDDRGSLRMENAELAHILGAVNIIYVDNPPLKGRNAETNKEIREESRKRVLTYLGKCRKTYRPENIDTLEERVQDYKTHEEKLKEKMKEIEADRKRQEEEFRKQLADMKEEQKRELRENQMQFEEKLHKAKVESDEKLRTTVNDLEDNQKKKINELEEKNKDQLKQSEERGKQEIKKVKDDQERQNKSHQEDLKKQREETNKLQEKLNKKDEDSAKYLAAMEQQRIDERARQDRLEAQRLDSEKKERQERREADQRRTDADNQWRREQTAKEEQWRREDKAKEEQRRKDEANKEESRQAKEEELRKQLEKQKEEARNLEAKVQEEKNKWFFERW
jgi:DNA repair exonuclease SbcCD ATPase subunit